MRQLKIKTEFFLWEKSASLLRDLFIQKTTLFSQEIKILSSLFQASLHQKQSSSFLTFVKLLILNPKEKFFGRVSSSNPLTVLLLHVNINHGLGNVRLLFSSSQPRIGKSNYEKEVLLMKKETCISFPKGVSTYRYFIFCSEKEADLKFIITISNSEQRLSTSNSQKVLSRNSRSEPGELADSNELSSIIQTMELL